MARDVLDLAMVAERAPDQIALAKRWFEKHKSAFEAKLLSGDYEATLRAAFAQIDTLDFDLSYDQCRIAALNAIQN